MKKYWTVFTLSLQNEFVYRLNFVLWRVRNVLRLLMTYFLWKGIYVVNTNVFGYTQNQMLTYVFMVLAVQTLVISAPSADNIGGEIGNGDLSNYLVKPIGYLKYWFTRDVSSKVLNLSFACGEIFLLWIYLRPELSLPTNFLTLFGFFILCIFAAVIYYLVSACARFIAFWTPEATWGLSFLILIFMEILAGGIFPLNVLPNWIYHLLQFTPFPYLVYFPIAVFSEKIVGFEFVRIVGQSIAWIIMLILFTRYLWGKGLVVYQSSGR